MHWFLLKIAFPVIAIEEVVTPLFLIRSGVDADTALLVSAGVGAATAEVALRFAARGGGSGGSTAPAVLATA